MIDTIKEQFKKVPRYVWILLAIIALGTFLRAYHLNDWLDFGDDQVHDAALVESVVTGETSWPLLGPDMSKSGNGQEGNSRANRFHIGPIYYYFQIVSAKIFGMNPGSLAYPDFLFSVLSIPLFYFFFTRYFGINLSLLLTGIYAISFYSLKFSHSAWNPNIIPFFALLFLLSLWKFLTDKEKISWAWAVFLGIALGVGIQLHAILLILFPATIMAVFLYLLKNKGIAWKKWSVVFLLVVVFNLGQVFSELETNFANSKAFISTVKGGDAGSGKYMMINFMQDAECHIQANLHIASSLGDKKDCSFYITNLTSGNKIKSQLKKIGDPWVFSGIVLAIIFSVYGYGLIVSRFRKEKDEAKRYFLGLILLYVSLSFLVLLPVISSALRYFVHVIFVPFIFIGLIVEWLIIKYPVRYHWIAGLLLAGIAVLNISAIYPVYKEFAENRRNTPREKIVVGESRAIVDFIIANSSTQREAYLQTSARTKNFSKPLNYLAMEKDFNLVIRRNDNDIPADKNIFYVVLHQDSTNYDKDKINIYKNFGQVDVYKLER
ncbi:MAG: glycosyltransferase family 39 protein [Candidatus Moranbacteria bacterium]|nr:glycosyltransferase family 39 protein [Candidatus Moranbacteria bacterium]